MLTFKRKKHLLIVIVSCIIHDNIENIVEDFKQSLYNNQEAKNLDFFKENFEKYTSKLEEIHAQDSSCNIQLMNDSNIKKFPLYKEI